MAFSRLAALALTAMTLPVPTLAADYLPGQVWEYRARPQDAGSLLKIQRIGSMGGAKVYHVSVIGLHLANPQISGTMPHLPVSEVTLDASVTALAPAGTPFPETDVDRGIAEWQAAKGGVFTIPVAEIAGILDDNTRDAKLPPGN